MNLTFDYFAKMNVDRSNEWESRGHGKFTTTDWTTALAGEAGEVCDAVKKLRRLELGFASKKDPKSYEEAVGEIAPEIADTIIYSFLLANHLGINVAKACIDKFNEVSEKNGFTHRL